MDKELPEFAILQNSETKKSAILTKKTGWTDAPIKDFEHLRLLATLIRTDPDPVKIVKYIAKANGDELA